MIISYLKISNFKRFADEINFDLQIKNKDKNIILIEAMNGVGKTSFLQAMKAAFFGISSNDFDKYLNYKAKDSNELEINLEVGFEDEDFNKYKILRQYSKRSVDTASISSQSTVHKNSELIISGENADDEILSFISKFIPKEISQFFFFDGEKIQHILDAYDPQKIKGSIEKILGIRSVRHLKEDIWKMKNSALRTADGDTSDEVKAHQNILKDLQEEYDILSKSLSETQTLLIEKNNAKSDIHERLKNLAKQGLTPEKQIEINELHQKIAKLNEKLSIGKIELNKFLEESLDTFLLEEIATDIDKSTSAESTINEEDVAEKIIKNLFIPKCINGGEELNLSKIDDIKGLIKQALNSNKDSDNTDNFEVSYQEKSSISLFTQSILDNDSPTDISETIKQIIDVEAELETLRRTLSDLEREMALTSNGEISLQELEISREDIETEIEKLRTSEILNQKTVEELVVKIERKTKELDSMLFRSEQKEGEKQYLKLLNSIHDTLEEFVDELVIDRKNSLESNTSEMFMQLANNKSYRGISIDDDFQVKAVNAEGIKEDQYLSSGYKQILMTSLIWGLERSAEDFENDRRLNLPVIIDTPLARLDPEHRNNMMDRYFPNAAIQVIILSQPSEISEEYRSRKNFKSHLKDDSYIKLNYDSNLNEMVLSTLPA